MTTNNVVDGLREYLSHGSSVTPFWVQSIRDPVVGADAVIDEGPANLESRLRLRMHLAGGGLLLQVVEESRNKWPFRIIERVRRGCY